MPSKNHTFKYRNTQNVQMGGKRETRKVSIFGNKGHKSIRKYVNGKMRETRKRLKIDEIQNIKWKRFIPGLFKDLGRK